MPDQHETPPLGAAGLGNLDRRAAFDIRVNNPPLSEIQAKFIGLRFGVRPDRAKLIAELAFDRGAA